jgi:hypothetical protein
LGANTLYAALTRDSWWLTPVLTPLQIIMQIVIITQSWYKYAHSKVDWRGRDIKLIVSKPIKHDNYTPAEQYREEYIGDFHVVSDKNHIKKNRHKHHKR